MREQTELCDTQHLNPLDSVEDVLMSHNWIYSRMNESELVVEVAGKACNYKLVFIWQEDLSALQLCCRYDIKVLPENIDSASQALMSLNSSVWMGHFELEYDTLMPRFRYTSLINTQGTHSDCDDYIESLVDICLNQCEHHFHVFNLLSSDNALNSDTLSLAMMDTVGES